MNEDFITYELAVKLKEKGFNELCYYYYQSGTLDTDNCWNRYNRGTENRQSAPTISQVLKWLREEKLILIGLAPMQEYGGDENIEWSAIIFKADRDGGLSWQEDLFYPNYEQAALAGIEYALDNLIP